MRFEFLDKQHDVQVVAFGISSYIQHQIDFNSNNVLCTYNVIKNKIEQYM